MLKSIRFPLCFIYPYASLPLSKGRNRNCQEYKNTNSLLPAFGHHVEHQSIGALTSSSPSGSPTHIVYSPSFYKMQAAYECGAASVFGGGARLPSILRLASCFSSFVGLLFFMSAVWAAESMEWPTDMPTRIYKVHG